jgi:uncharacterized membrane protein YcaP (DUF421 family)
MKQGADTLMHEYINIFIRSISALILLLIIARILGKQTISNMTFNDFVTGITLGALAANLAFNEKITPWNFIFSLIVITMTSYLLSIIAMKSRYLRNWISGSPTVMIEGGNILENNMKKVRYTIDSLNQSLREKDIFDIEEVEYALLEDNGKLSVLKKDEYRYITKKDLHIISKTLSFPVELIMDGDIILDNLERNGLTKEWLAKELKKRGKKISDVFYGVRGTRQQLIFDFYEDNLSNPLDNDKDK